MSIELEAPSPGAAHATPAPAHPRSTPPPVAAGDVRAALARAERAALALQRADGAWQSRNDAGPLFLGAALALERALGTLRAADARDGERTLRAAQRADGSTAAWAFADHGTLEATSFWLAGMRAVGVADDDPAVRRARAFVDARGGLRANRVIVQAVLAAVDLLDPRALPRVPLAYKLVPGHEAALAALLGVNALVPAHALPAVIRGLRDRGAPRSRLRRRADRAVVAYLGARQDPSGSWAGVPFYTLLAALALRLSGVAHDDPRVVRAVDFARSVYTRDAAGALHVGPFHSTHWDTAHMLRALAHLGPEHPAVAAGARFLLAGQAREPSPRDWQTPPRGAPATGGWAWQPGNARNPDLDSTAEVLSALAPLARASRDPALCAAVVRGAAWLVPYQNPDGGWGAFSHRALAAPLGALFTRVEHAPPARSWRERAARWRERVARRLAEAGDPSTADVTGRVLYALGALGAPADDARVRAAVSFLARHQLPSGAWWSRWSVNYLPATSYIVTGLRAVGVSRDDAMIARAVRWMLARQNADGGWGELPRSFEDPAFAGCGPSSVQVTGVVVWALVTAGADPAAVDRGVRWLLARQRADGGWSDDACYGVIFPHLHYYFSDAFPLYFATEALRAWGAAREVAPP